MTNAIAQTILEQLGGNRFVAMTGAVCMSAENELHVKLPKISKLSAVVIHYSEITDTYTFQGFKGRGVKIAKHGQPVFGLHADQLRTVFEAETSLRTSL